MVEKREYRQSNKSTDNKMLWVYKEKKVLKPLTIQNRMDTKGHIPRGRQKTCWKEQVAVLRRRGLKTFIRKSKI